MAVDKEWLVAKRTTGLALTIERERPAATARTALAPGTSLVDLALWQKIMALTGLTEVELLAALDVADERVVVP